LESLRKLRKLLKFPEHKPFDRQFREQDQNGTEIPVSVLFFTNMGIHYEVVLFSKNPGEYGTVPQDSKEVFVKANEVAIKHCHSHSVLSEILSSATVSLKTKTSRHFLTN